MSEILSRKIESIGTRGKDGRIQATLSTEYPVERHFGKEILDHSPGSIDDERAKNGLSLLFGHDTMEPVGRVEGIHLEGRKLKGYLRPGNSTRAKEVWADIEAGILQDLSIGYQIFDEGEREGKDIYRFKRWMPYEVSVLPIGADPQAGINRAAKITNTGGLEMSEIEITEEGQAKNRAERRSEKHAERTRVNDMLDLGSSHNCLEMAREFIQEGKSADELSKAILRSKTTKPLWQPAAEDIDSRRLSEREVRQFSIVKAIKAAATNDWDDAGYEREISREIERKTGKRAQGFFVPVGSLTRGLTKGDPTGGGSLVATNLMGDGFIDTLRAKSQVINLGATVLYNLVGDVAIPRMTGSATAYWVGEGEDVTLSQQILGQVSMIPKTLGGRTQMSRKLLNQSTPGIEQLVKNDLVAVIATELDRVAINGAGVSNEPTGILNTAGIGVVAIGANGGAPDWADIVSLASDLEQSNADNGNLAYLTNAKVKKTLLQAEKSSGTGLFVWEVDQNGEGRLVGYRALVSNNVPSNLTKGSGTNLSAIIFGNWQDLIIGQWGSGVDILVDPYTLAASGGLQVRVLLDMDVAVRHPESFAVIKDAIA